MYNIYCIILAHLQSQGLRGKVLAITRPRSSRAHAIVTQRSTPEYDGPPHGHSRDFWNIHKMGGGRLCPTSSKMTTVLWTKWVLNNYQAVGQFEAELHGSGLKPWQRSEDPKRVLTAVVSTHPKNMSEMGLSSQLVCSEQHFQLNRSWYSR